jgi:hypothetical protein
LSGGRTEDLIRELARDLDPVEPLPRIRTVTTGVAALWFAAAGIGLTVLGLRPDLVEATLQVRGVAVVFAGLGLAGVGGVIAALAMGVPGREVLARSALAVAILGMVVAAAIGTLLFATSPAAGARVPFTGDLACLTVALLVAHALAPAVGVLLLTLPLLVALKRFGLERSDHR